eukprot:764173-Hanusia_phi.AAC.1
MYVKYNNVLRSSNTNKSKTSKRKTSEVSESNKYTTTIHCIVSGVIKLSKLTKLPPSRLVYRGLSGLWMPERFVQEDKLGVSGGVEYGMLSTTEKREIAVQYATNKGTHPTVFAISCGAIDRGADLGFLSQYPDEKEFLYPPLSYLEVTRRPRLEEVDGQVVRVLPMRINANLTSSTIERILGKRKELYMALLTNIGHEINRELEGELRSDRVKQRLKQSPGDALFMYHKKLQRSVSRDVQDLLSKYDERDIEWYNSDFDYVRAMEHATSLKQIAMNKFRYWLDSTKGDTQCEGVSKESMADLYRKTLADLHHKAFAGGRKNSEGRDAATKACTMQGMWREQHETGGGEESPILAAAAKGQADMIKLLAIAGQGLNDKDKDGNTALHIAATLDFRHCLEELVKHDAD